MNTFLHQPDNKWKILRDLPDWKQIAPFAYLLFLTCGASLIGSESIRDTKLSEINFLLMIEIPEAETSFSTLYVRSLTSTGDIGSNLKNEFTFLSVTIL